MRHFKNRFNSKAKSEKNMENSGRVERVSTGNEVYVKNSFEIEMNDPTRQAVPKRSPDANELNNDPNGKSSKFK